MLVSSVSFSKRFKELVKDLSDTELGYILGVSADAARKMRVGDIKSIKLEAGLRLAKAIGVSPWYLAGEAEPTRALPAGPGHRDKSRTQRSLARAQLETAESALLLHDEIAALRVRVERLERAVATRRSRSKVSSSP